MVLERADFVLLSLTRIFVVSVRRSSSSSRCFGKTALFYCGSPWAFRMTILDYINWTFLYLCRLSSKIHYANTPMQYTAIFHGGKNVNFHLIFLNIFLIFAQNIDCGGSNEYPQSMF